MKNSAIPVTMAPMAGRIKLEIDTETLRRLLDSGQLCAADIRCLDCASKHCVWKLCLQSLGREMTCPQTTPSVPGRLSN